MTTTNQQGAPTAEEAKENAQPSADGDQGNAGGDADQRFKDQQRRAELAEKEAKEAKERADAAERRAQEAEAKAAAAAGSGSGSGDGATLTPEMEAEIARFAEESDVDPKFAKSLAQTVLKASSEVSKATLAAALADQEAQAKKERVQSEFDKAFDTVANSDTFKGIKINKDRIRELQFANPGQTVEQIVSDLYGEVAKPAEDGVVDPPEDGTKHGAERGGGTIDFEKITPEQREAVMADPEAKAKYFAYLDSKGS